jgi:hypothetical protein
MLIRSKQPPASTVTTPNGPGEAALGMGVEGDVRRSDEDGVEGGVMSYERHSTEGIIADAVGRGDDKGKWGVEGCMSTASVFIVTVADAVALRRCIRATLRTSLPAIS